MGKRVDDVNTYRVGHPLAKRLLDRAKGLVTKPGEVVFHYRDSRKKIAVLDSLLDCGGWLSCGCVTMSALETQDVLVFAGLTDGGIALDDTQCRRLFDLPAVVTSKIDLPDSITPLLDAAHVRRRQELLDAMTARNVTWFDTEMEKLDRWAEDRRASLKAELEDLDNMMKQTKRAARMAPNLPEKLERQREARRLETRRDEAWRAYDEASRDIDRQKDALLDEISHRLEGRIEQKPLFAIRWTVT